MDCAEVRHLFIIRLLGKLTPLQENTVREHLKFCPECADHANMVEGLGDLLEKSYPPGGPDWNQSWRVIRQGLLVKPRSRVIPVTPPKIAFAGALLCLVFLIGFYVGRGLLIKARQDHTESVDNLWTTYTDKLEFVLIEFSNRKVQTDESEMILLEKTMVEQMLVQTRFLKEVIRLRKNVTLSLLLDEVEIILISMNNLRPEDHVKQNHLKQVIRERSIREQLKKLSFANLFI